MMGVCTMPIPMGLIEGSPHPTASPAVAVGQRQVGKGCLGWAGRNERKREQEEEEGVRTRRRKRRNSYRSKMRRSSRRTMWLPGPPTESAALLGSSSITSCTSCR